MRASDGIEADRTTSQPLLLEPLRHLRARRWMKRPRIGAAARARR